MEVDVFVNCDECGESLDIVNERGTELYVKPCKYCLEKELKSGYYEGYDEGYTKAESELADDSN